MTFKKVISSDGVPYIIGNDSGKDNKFLPGFRYKLGSVEYTVRKVITKEANSFMRRLICSDGSIEDVSVDTIMKDLQDEDCIILPIDENIALVEGVIKKEENNDKGEESGEKK